MCFIRGGCAVELQDLQSKFMVMSLVPTYQDDCAASSNNVNDKDHCSLLSDVVALFDLACLM
jgi:hypothetical protein